MNGWQIWIFYLIKIRPWRRDLHIIKIYCIALVGFCISEFKLIIFSWFLSKLGFLLRMDSSHTILYSLDALRCVRYSACKNHIMYTFVWHNGCWFSCFYLCVCKGGGDSLRSHSTPKTLCIFIRFITNFVLIYIVTMFELRLIMANSTRYKRPNFLFPHIDRYFSLFC